jgi:hypothetical protein
VATDNFEQIKDLLTFWSEDDFYHLQILKRKKEHPELGSNSYVVKTYYIRSRKYLEQKKDEIVALCNFHNARGCINLNRRSFEKIAFHTLKKITDQILNKDYKSVRKAFESVCGAHSNEAEKKWILDIDSHDPLVGTKIASYIANCQPIGEKVIATIPTKNGYHLITKPFNIQDFNFYKMMNKVEVDIHKDNPTIIYIP